MHIGFLTQVGTQVGRWGQVGQTGFVIRATTRERCPGACRSRTPRFAVCGDTGPLTQHPMRGIPGSQLQKQQRALLISYPPKTHASLTVVWGIVTLH